GHVREHGGIRARPARAATLVATCAGVAMSRVRGAPVYNVAPFEHSQAERKHSWSSIRPGPGWPTSSSVTRRSGGIFELDAKKESLIQVLAELETPNVWKDQARAQELGRERARLSEVIDTLERVGQHLTESTELL